MQVLRDDALIATEGGFAVRVSLPWIRSLPLSSVSHVVVRIDGTVCDEVRADVGGRSVPVEALADVEGWWFIQDRLSLSGPGTLRPGSHVVSLSFDLLVPYLESGPDVPLTIPVRTEQSLAAAHDVPWTLAASAFNWTPDVIRAERAAPDVAAGIVTHGVSTVMELELGQLWRSFPHASTAETTDLKARIDAAGGRVSIVGVSLDDWLSPTRRRDEDERLAFLRPQLQAAHDLGAEGVRLPIGQAGPILLRHIQPLLHDLGLTLYEELQGRQAPQSPATASAIEQIVTLDDPRIRLLVDTSMLMPALPVSYLDRLGASGVPADLLARLTDAWLDPATLDSVVAHLHSGGVPPASLPLYMNLLVRFGSSSTDELRGILPLVGAFHLKFWDLDDADGRVSEPIRELGALLRGSGFSGTLCSEWGGHEWLDLDPTAVTRADLALVRTALGALG